MLWTRYDDQLRTQGIPRISLQKWPQAAAVVAMTRPRILTWPKATVKDPTGVVRAIGRYCRVNRKNCGTSQWEERVWTRADTLPRYWMPSPAKSAKSCDRTEQIACATRCRKRW